MQPTRRARARGSPARPVRRPRPSLSSDKLATHFRVDDVIRTDLGDDEEYTWHPHEVRFVLWYHLTTHLPLEAIATAFNVTYGADSDDVPEMQGENAQTIIETIKERMEEIDEDISERALGQWARPTDAGWIPCDHELPCATLAEASNGRLTSVMRNTDLKTRGSADIAAMAVGLWEGGWDEILECPRKHKQAVPKTTTPTYPPPTVGAFQRTPRYGERRRRKIEIVNISDDDTPAAAQIPAASNAAPVSKPVDLLPPSKPGSSVRTSPRKTPAYAPSLQRSAPDWMGKREEQSPVKNLRSTIRSRNIRAVQDDPNIDVNDSDLGAPNSTEAINAAIASGHKIRRTVVARYGDTRVERVTIIPSGNSAASPHQQTSFSSALTDGCVKVKEHFKEEYSRIRDECAKIWEDPRAPRSLPVWMETVCHVFAHTVVGLFVVSREISRSIECFLILNASLRLDVRDIYYWSDMFDVRNCWPVLQCLCTMVAYHKAQEYMADRLKRHLWQRWGSDTGPTPRVPAPAYLVYLGIAWTMACYFYPRWNAPLLTQIPQWWIQWTAWSKARKSH